MTTRGELEALTRDGLIERARRLGVPRPEVMTRVEMVDEILRRQETDAAARRRARGWLGVARDLVASLIEQGLNMPDAAKLVRQGVTPTLVQHQPPVATVTLAEIYAAQGHVKRAIRMLDEVLDKEPDHAVARALRDRLATTRPTPTRAVEPEQPEEVAEPAADATTEREATAAERERAVAPAGADAVAERAATAGSEVGADAAAERAATEAQSGATVGSEVGADAAAERERAVALASEVGAPPPRDDVLVLMPSERGVRVYWELSARGRAAALGADVVLELVSFAPCPGGARRQDRSVAITTPAGALLVADLRADAVVRGALGVARGGAFEPWVVGSVVDVDDALVFAPLGADAPDRPALERARRAVAVL